MFNVLCSMQHCHHQYMVSLVMFVGVILLPIVYGFKRSEAKFPGQMGLCSPSGSSLMCFRVREVSGSSLHAQQTLSRNTPYRDAIRGEFRQQTSRGHNEDLITLDARYGVLRNNGKCVARTFKLIEHSLNLCFTTSISR